MNDTVALTGPAQKKRDKYFALLGIGVLTEKQVAEAQKLARTILKADVAEDKAKARKLSATEKDKLLYQARWDKSELALGELRRMLPTTEKLVADFERAHAAATRLADGSDWTGALKELKKVSATDAPDKARKLWTDAGKGASKKAPEAMSAVQEMNRMLSAPDHRLPAGVVVDIRNEMTRIGRPLLVDRPGDDAVADATRELTTLRDRLAADIEDARADHLRTELLRAETSRALSTIAPLSGDEPPLLTDRDAAPLRLALASAATSMTSHDFEAARRTLEPLRLQIEAVRTRVGPLRAAWAEHAPRLGPLLLDARKLAAGATSPPVQQEARALAVALEEVQTQGAGRGIGYADAVDRVEGAADAIAALRERERQWQRFQTGDAGDDPPDAVERAQGIAPARKRIDAHLREIDSAFDRLHGAVRKQTDGHRKTVADGRYAERRDAAVAAWEARIAEAHDIASLDEAGTRATLIALRDDIVDAIDDPGRLQQAIDGGRLDRARDAYRAARQSAFDACEAAVATDAASGGASLARAEAICAKVDDGATVEAYRKAAGALNKLAETVRGQAAGQGEAVAEAQRTLQAELDALVPKLGEIRALADKAKTGAKQQPLVALLDTLQASLDALRAMRKLTQLSLLNAAIDEAAVFADEVDDSLAAARGGGDAAGSMSFDAARRTIANLKVEIAEKDHKLYGVSTQFALDERVKAIEKGLGTTTMSQLSKSLAELTTDVEALKRSAADAKERTKQFEKTVVAGLLKTLDGKTFKDDAPDYRASMIGRVKSLLDDHRFEGGAGTAMTRAGEIERELAAVLQGEKDPRGVPQALADRQAGAEKAKNDKIVDRGKWEGESEVLGKRLKSLLSINPTEIQALQDSLDSAVKAVKKSDDYASGREQLMTIRSRLSLLEANPNGLAIAARNKLPQVNRRVKNAMAALHAALTDVDRAVLSLPDSDVAVDGKAVVSGQIAAVRGLFNAALFDDAVAKMTAKGSPRELRSGAREAALRDVRRLQTYLNHDARLRMLAEAPFASGTRSVVSETMLALLDLENNMLVSI